MEALTQSVLRFSDRHDLLPHHARIVVAVSGGPDSLCLLHLLHHEIGPRRSLELHVAHLDHRLRADSQHDAQFVAATATAWALPFTIGTSDVAALARETHTGLEAAGRTARYAFLVHTAQQIGARAIAVGHTADDQAETVIQRVLRGAGVHGLAAMRPRRFALDPPPAEHPPLFIVRPLLQTTRAAVEAYCAAYELRPRTDPTNESGPFLRNRVRDHILPLLKTYNPSIVDTLGRVARVCAVDDDLLEALADDAWQQAAQHMADQVVFEREHFEQTHPAIQRRLVRRSVQTLRPHVELQAQHIDLVLDAITMRRRRMQLPGGLWLHNDAHSVVITTRSE
jgi:tRNA(Ile)-lysidine synthetase-like protein